jgi:hypothetical protein
VALPLQGGTFRQEGGRARSAAHSACGVLHSPSSGGSR